MELHSFHLSFTLIAAMLIIVAAVRDAKSFKIPNWIWASLIGLFPLYVLSSPQGIAWLHHLGVFALVLGLGFALFAGNLTGAGDVKLLSAIALWAGPNFIGVLLIVTALSGGVLALGYALASWLRHKIRPWTTPHEDMQDILTKTAIPYGVAIACGGLTAIGMMVMPLL